jgi:acetolactate decarboxylase
MKKQLSYFVFALSLIAFGCATIPTNTITQISTVKSIKENNTAPLITNSELTRFGSMGIGIIEGLQGQVIINNNNVYEISDKFAVTPAFGFTELTYANIVNFNWDTQLNISSRKTMLEIEKIINTTVPNNDIICALKIKGKFLNIKLTTISTKAAGQIEYEDISGTIVGFRFPKYLKDISPEGFMFFFIADNKKNGGDVVDFLLQTGTTEIDLCNKLNIKTAIKLND